MTDGEIRPFFIETGDRMKKRIFENAVICLAAIVIFLLPVKFGGLTGIPEVAPMFPRSFIALVIITWPPSLFAPFAAILLLAAVLAFPLPDFSNRPLWICAGLWILTFLSAFLGLINASTSIFPYVEMVHFGGLASFMLAMYLILSQRPDAKKLFIASIVCGLTVTLLLGLEQYFNGFSDTMKFIEKREQETGVQLAGDFKVKVADIRIFSTFSASNAYAGYILLTLPLALALIYRLSQKVEPAKLSKIVFTGLFALLALFIFGYTRSRAAYLSLLAMISICVIAFRVNGKLRIATAILVPIIIVGGVILISMTERSFSSMRVRIDYILRSLEMLLAHPFAGTGWGDFFHDYMSMKTYPNSEAPHMPHNVIMAFAGQTGIFGMLAVAAAMLYPLTAGWNRLRKLPVKEMFFSVDGAIFMGLVAFFVHCLFDVHLQIPANMALLLLFGMLLLTPDETQKETAAKRKWGAIVPVIVLCLCTCAATFHYGSRLLKYEECFERLLDQCDRRTRSPQEFMSIPPAKVMALLKECIELMPGSTFPWFTVGDFMMGQGRVLEAEQMYLKAYELNPKRPALQIRFYHINKLRGDDAKAREHLNRALEMFPKHEKYIELKKQEYGE